MSTNSQPLEMTGAFYLDESTFKELVKVITKFTGSDYSIDADFEDKFNHRTNDLSTLIEHPHFRVS